MHKHFSIFHSDEYFQMPSSDEYFQMPFSAISISNALCFISILSQKVLYRRFLGVQSMQEKLFVLMVMQFFFTANEFLIWITKIFFALHIAFLKHSILLAYYKDVIHISSR